MTYRFHILGIPHTISTPEYSACAFTQKVVKLCRMLRMRGHEVIHYGHEDSEVDCSEHVTVTTRADMEASYPGHDWKRNAFPAYGFGDPIYKAFMKNTVREIAARRQPRDFLLCPFGANHKPIADALPGMIVVESGIGYPGGGFAPYRVFESYAVMHAYHGIPAVESMSHNFWYDAVIPNAYDLGDFEYRAAKDDYFLFLGRVNPGKGIQVAIQIAEATNTKLVIAGPGVLGDSMARTSRPLSEYVEMTGVVGPDERKVLLSHAKAVLTPSMFLEPFCGVHVEAMLSGTPVISSDWGAFAEYNIHGVTGYRCKTFEQFEWGARHIGRINPRACRAHAERTFSLERVAAMYDEYFFAVNNIYGSDGWYEANPSRKNLDWLT